MCTRNANRVYDVCCTGLCYMLCVLGRQSRQLGACAIDVCVCVCVNVEHMCDFRVVVVVVWC